MFALHDRSTTTAEVLFNAHVLTFSFLSVSPRRQTRRQLPLVYCLRRIRAEYDTWSKSFSEFLMPKREDENGPASPFAFSRSDVHLSCPSSASYLLILVAVPGFNRDFSLRYWRYSPDCSLIKSRLHLRFVSDEESALFLLADAR